MPLDHYYKHFLEIQISAHADLLGRIWVLQRIYALIEVLVISLSAYTGRALNLLITVTVITFLLLFNFYNHLHRKQIINLTFFLLLILKTYLIYIQMFV